MDAYAVLIFLPTLFSIVSDPDPIKVGLRGLATALGTTVGACFGNAALSWFKGYNREVLLTGIVLMSMPPIPAML